MNTTIFVEASFRIVATVKGHPLAPRETLMVPVELNNFVADEDFEVVRKIFFPALDAALRVELAKQFVSKLKKDTWLKRQVGGTKWSVDLVGSVEEFPMYTAPAKLGDYMKFINKKDVYKIVEQIVHRNTAILRQLNDERLSANADQIAKRA